MNNTKGLNFRDFVVYRYARPERLNMRTPGNKMIRTALTVLEDVEFPVDPKSREEIIDYVYDHLKAPGIAGRRAHVISALCQMFAEYRGWRVGLDMHTERWEDD